MPSCSWYGTLKDHIEILNYLFQKKNCSIYESYSDFEKPIRIFSNVEEIIQEFQSNTIFLNIYVQGSGPKFKARKILLDPKKCNGAKYRFSSDGWGMIQLHLSTNIRNRLCSSYTNHNTLKRAEKWEKFYKDLDSPSQWNFDSVIQFSNQFIRKIKSQTYAKIGSRIVTKNAFLLWENGYFLDIYQKEKDTIQVL
ncbi:hypothetical protein LEP1GSC186_3011 [Leptospira noguchii serovar Autumnalis str. ZUN142]|uniref:Uncharacterized protein n=1 Tax=Leptospira noguchii serovar Autumnalis str. ZUN142 TaxID=1085540 RepID=M6UV67_9LEPT|nr:hypothetical protein LEP1GSC186_3011 [Leptospira noguchii serovar Autumnalis str. ZUN142]